MAITSYADLQTSIANFLARDDLTTQIPDFIQLAEARINRELETREQEKRVQATLVAGDEYIALPVDLREVREVKLNTSPLTVLSYASPTGLDTQYSSNGQGKPQGYSIVGKEMKIRPIPDSGYTMEIVYIGDVDALSAVSTPILFTRSPDLYLYGALTEAYVYLLDEQRAAQYDEKFTRAINEVRMDEERSHYGTGPLQTKSVYLRQNVTAEK
jgi:hypothetical protein